MSNIQFDTPANRVIAQQQPKNQFRIDTSLPDLPFLRQLSIQGRLRYFNGEVIDDTANAITITPTEGETLFIYQLIVTNSTNNIVATLFNNDQTRLVIRSGTSGTNVSDASIIPIVDSLVGNGLKTIRVEIATATNGIGNVSLLGWVENTSRIRDVTS